jgi:hypothetical protein
MNIWPLALSLLAVLSLFCLTLLFLARMQKSFLTEIRTMQAERQEETRITLNLLSSKDPMTFQVLQAAQSEVSLTPDYIPTDDESEYTRYSGLTDGQELGYDDESIAEREALSELADLGFVLDGRS